MRERGLCPVVAQQGETGKTNRSGQRKRGLQKQGWEPGSESESKQSVSDYGGSDERRGYPGTDNSLFEACGVPLC